MYQSSTSSELALLTERNGRNSVGFPTLPDESIAPRPVISLGKILRNRYKYLLFCGAVSAAIAALVADRFSQSTWTYSSELLHQPISAEASGFAPLDQNTLRGMVKSHDTLEQLTREFSLTQPLAALDKSFEVDVPNAGKAIVVKLTWNNPTQAETMLNRIDDLLVQKVDRLRHEALQQLGQDCADKVERARLEQTKVQDALAALCDSMNVLDVEKDLASLHDDIAVLEVDLRKQRGGQSALLAQKNKVGNLAAALMVNQLEIGVVQSLLVARREAEQKLRGVRRQFLALNDGVIAATLNRQKAEEALDANKQLQNSQFHEVSVVQAARPGLVPFVSNYKKLLAGAFILCGVVLAAPAVVLDTLAAKEPPVSATARMLGLPILASRVGDQRNSRVWKSKDNGASEDFARLLSLRVQQCVGKHGYVLLFSNMDRGPSPISLLGKLAKCFSQRDHRVLLVETGSAGKCETALKELLMEGDRDCHLRSGLADYVAFKESDIDQLTVPTLIPDVDCLLPGSSPLPSEALGTRRFSELFDQLRERYTLIIVIGPGAHEAVDLEMQAARADGIIFYASNPHHVDPQAASVVRHLVNLEAPILGIIS